MTFNEFDTVRILKDFPEKDVVKGDTGTIVMTYSNPQEAYEVEIVNDDGTTKALLTLSSNDLEII